MNKLKAIQALLDGVYDDPSLAPVNSLTAESNMNVEEIMKHEDVINFVPEAAVTEWNDIQYEMVREVEDNGKMFCEVTDEIAEATMFSVYLRQASGGVKCIADLATLEQAQNLALLIKTLVNSYKDNGYLNCNK